MNIALINPKFVGVGGLKTVNENLSKILKAHTYVLNGGMVDSPYKVPKIVSYLQIPYSMYDAIMIMFQPSDRDKTKTKEVYASITKLARDNGCKIFQRMHKYQPLPDNIDVDCVVCNSKAQQEFITSNDSVIIRNPTTPLKGINYNRDGAIWFTRFGSGQTKGIEYTSDKCTTEISEILNQFKVPVSVFGNHVGVYGYKLKRTLLTAIEQASNVSFYGSCNTTKHRVKLICASKVYINSTVHGWNEDIGTSLVECMQYKCVPIASEHYLEAGYIKKNMGLFFNNVKEIPQLVEYGIENYDDLIPMLESNRKFIIKNQGNKTTYQKYNKLMNKYIE